MDANKYINEQRRGGGDRPYKLIPNDYAYQIPKAVNLYKKVQGTWTRFL